MSIKLKRAYESPSAADGRRVLVDRIWPRGIGKEAARLDEWLKEVAPSSGLRKWYGHDPERWDEFRKRYFEELKGRPAPVEALAGMARAGTLTLIYAARDGAHSNAAALKDYIEEEFGL